MHHYDRLKNTSLISAWKVRMTSRFEQRRGKLETIVNLQTFYLLIHLKLVNQKLTIMGAIPQIAKEKLKLDKVGIKEYQSTCKLKWLFLHHLQIKTKIIKCILYTVPNGLFTLYNAATWKGRETVKVFKLFCTF